jgi:two-component system OmpR family sensor kinase
MRRVGFKTRLWLGHVVVLAAMLALAAFAADWALRRIVLGRIIDDAILSLAFAEAGALEADPRPPVRVHELPPGVGHPSFARLDKFVQIIRPDGGVVAAGATLGTARLPRPPWLLARLEQGEPVFDTLTDFGEEPVRMVSLPISAADARYAVQVAMSLDDAYAVLRVGRWVFLGMSLVLLAGVGLTAAVLARQALRPIDELVARARRIGEGNLAERLPHPGTRDEIGRLVETLNEMLRRLERSFEVQRGFTADASHELRSPLSRLRAELEVTLRRPRDVPEYEETLRSSLEEVERLQRLVEELLALARLDAGQERETPQPVPVGEIVDAAVASVEQEAERRGIAIAVASPPPVLVNAAPVAAKIVLANILDNAVKFSPAGGRVTVRITADGDTAVIAVSDSGPGMAADELPRLFHRFYRGHASRSTGASGVGLGLAISRALVERQGGSIAVSSGRGAGATFSVQLPRVPVDLGSAIQPRQTIQPR